MRSAGPARRPTTLPDWSARSRRGVRRLLRDYVESPIVTVVTVARSSASGSSLPVLAVSSSSRINARSSLIVLVTSLRAAGAWTTY